MTTPNLPADRQSTPPRQAAPFQPAALLTYTFPPALVSRLSAEQGWSAGHTARVLTEYRRFLHLAASGGGPVTPSQAVDEAWHLHLTFTRDYWERLTPLLPAPLHHEPADGSSADAARYRQQYLETLDRYARMYGERPPLDLWPDPRLPRPGPTPAPPSHLCGLSAVRLVLGLVLAAGMVLGFHPLLGLYGSLALGVLAFGLVQVPAVPLGVGVDGGGGDGVGDSDSGGDSGSDGGSDGGGGGGGCGGGCGS